MQTTLPISSEEDHAHVVRSQRTHTQFLALVVKEQPYVIGYVLWVGPGG